LAEQTFEVHWLAVEHALPLGSVLGWHMVPTQL
jgi:hypothetical protein